MIKEKKDSILIYLISIRYYISLKIHKIKINRLDLNNRINAIINNYVTNQIYELLSEKITNKDKNTIKMMKDEIMRIDALTESYNYGFIEKMTYEEMKSIISYYANSTWQLKKIEKDLNILFQKEPKKKFTKKNNNKIIYFNPQN